MSTSKLYTYTVEGSLCFPLDMLRRDTCWPASEATDVPAILATFDIERPRTVTRITLVGIKKPTIARWLSFGYRVIE